ncbi:MAG: pyruvate dehydrogenase (acetyl-transferring) E1 component subunit alpha [Pseudomonadota bacterium]|nr:pyruvate dehydrogenase (acetyl-transferring) E1 component subunit alpha [Pseudomonadales bacterium]MDY6920410.1 pyruvate dehydrogenase (acetyl-transferring) E1 component subunit alpha [Pseudomonadota bacterium]
MQYTTTPRQQQQFITPEGELTGSLPEAMTGDWLQQAYTTMVLVRTFDQRVVALQRTGQMGTYASCLGQEAIGTGIGLALQPDDVFLPYYRDQATQYLRGVSFTRQMQYWGGDEWGNHFPDQAAQDFPNCVPIATQVTHAAGVASAMKIRGEKRCALVTCGEGATSRGDFYEAMNLAGVWQLPMIMVVNNNQWAISVPRQIQTGAATIAQKAEAAGIEGFQVDGNDVCAVYDVVRYAVAKAHCGKGPTLIEAVSYRLGDHTTADDATRYRQHEEVNAAWQREPIKRLQTYLHQQGLWSEAKEQSLQQQCKQEVEAAVEAYLALPEQPLADLFDYLFEERPRQLDHQYERAQAKLTALGGE